LSPDWLHFNSVTYNEALDQILISVHTLSELWIIDHSTTIAEAATSFGGNSGRGGDILYRWGNPATYDLGTANNQDLYAQHHATWIPAGMPYENHILVFNNGLNSPQGDFSSILIIEPPVNSHTYDLIPGQTYAPAEASWTYAPDTALFFGGNLGGVFPVSNGNYLATVGPSANFIEISNSGEILWRYKSPIAGNGILSQGSNMITAPVFRAEFIPIDFPGLAGHNLQAYGEIELNPQSPSICEELGIGVGEEFPNFQLNLFPNPSIDCIHIKNLEVNELCRIFNTTGQCVMSFAVKSNHVQLDTTILAKGIYFVCVGEKKISFMKE
jgi:hypothetical protein